jgi:hypothetical protein
MEAKELIQAISGSGGIIAALVTIAVLVYSRMDKRKEHQEGDYHGYVDAQKNVIDTLNKMLEDKNAEIIRLEAKLSSGEDKGILTLPKIQKISAEVRTIREALSRLNVLVMSHEETMIFAERFSAIKEAVQNIDKIVSE